MITDNPNWTQYNSVFNIIIIMRIYNFNDIKGLRESSLTKWYNCTKNDQGGVVYFGGVIVFVRGAGGKIQSLALYVSTHIQKISGYFSKHCLRLNSK